MRQTNITYAKAEASFYEAMRINKGSSKAWATEKEANSLINTNLTHLNYEVIPHHAALDPSNYGKHNRGEGIAAYHKEVTGRSARMKGEEAQLSKAVGCIITMPRDYMDFNFDLTDGEYAALAASLEVEHAENKAPESVYLKAAVEKLKNRSYTAEELGEIKKFFYAATKSWQKVAGIRDEDMLFAVVHLDQTFPHVHIMACPTVLSEEPTKKVTFSTSKYSNRATHYFDNLHTNVIEVMATDYGIDASGLINGATKGRGFIPGEQDKIQREERVKKMIELRAIEEKRKQEELKYEAVKLNRQYEEKRKQDLQEANDRLSEHTTTLQQRQKELKKNGKTTEVLEHDYNKYYEWKMADHDIRMEREKLENAKADFDATLEKRVQERLPDELRQAKEDRLFVEKNLERVKRAKQIEENYEQAVEREVEKRLTVRIKEALRRFVQKAKEAVERKLPEAIATMVAGILDKVAGIFLKEMDREIIPEKDIELHAQDHDDFDISA